MQIKTTITRTDAVDGVFALHSGRTDPIQLPTIRGGAFIRVFDTPARGREYTADGGPDWPGDFLIQAVSRMDRQTVRIAAVPGGALEAAASVYVLTRGNQWTEEATVEVYEGEENG